MNKFLIIGLSFMISHSLFATDDMNHAHKGHVHGELIDGKDLDVDHRNAEGTTPLMCAVFAGDLPCCKVLVKAGAWIDARNKMGQTCLMKAVCYRDMRMIEWLLKEGADPTLRDKEQKKALDYSEERNFDEVTRVLRGERTILKDDMWDDALEDELNTLEMA